MRFNRVTNPARGSVPRARWAALAALLVPLAACDGLLDVSDPDVTRPEALTEASALPTVYAGALGDFSVAMSGHPGCGGGCEGIIASIALLSDEMYHSGTFAQRREVDKRNIAIDNSIMTRVFRDLHRARRSAEIAAQGFGTHQPNSAGQAEVTSLAAYVYTIFGEAYCSGVPFSELRPDNTFEFGSPLTTEQMFARAGQLFDDARQIAGAGTSGAFIRQQHLAKVGRARVMLSQNQYAEAAALVADVPTEFVYAIEHSENTDRQNNGLWAVSWGTRRFAVSHREGGNGLPFRQGVLDDPASQDPRVRWTRTNDRGIDTPFAHFFQQKFPVRTAPVPVATGIEARLIQAEAALARGQSNQYLPILNELRANSAVLLAGLGVTGGSALAPLTDPGTPAGRVDQLFRERAFWLYMTGTRVGDMRRLVRQYGRAVESVFPTGIYQRALYASIDTPSDELGMRADGEYGPDVNFPVPFDEQNNPEFSQCISRDA